MLDVLQRAEKALPNLLREPADTWHTLDVDYSPPRVERLWRPFEGRYRLSLHRIHPCDIALLHPHPWPSAVKVITGKYEHVVQADSVGIVTRQILAAGSAYEMLDPLVRHSVRPIDEPSLSIMVTDRPWQQQLYSHDQFGKAADLGPLSERDAASLFKAFQDYYHYWRPL